MQRMSSSPIFRTAEIEGAAHFPVLPKDLVEAAQGPKLWGKRPQIAGRRLAPIFRIEERPYLRIGEARSRLYDRFKKAIGRDAAARADGHLADHREAVHLRHERTQAVG